MKSIRTIYKYGCGPSSSHTVGPTIAAKVIKKYYPEADRFEAVLYGSLALTGRGHMTDRAIMSILDNCSIIFDYKKTDLPHPNTMVFRVFKDDELVAERTVLSVGGGEIKILDDDYCEEEVYEFNHLSDIIHECENRNISLADYIYEKEKGDIKEELRNTWHRMEDCIQRGLNTVGLLPGDLMLERKANKLYNMVVKEESPTARENRLVSAYAYAVAEENAAGKMVVIAPTCGASGVLPAVLYYLRHDRGYSEEEIIDGLAVAGMIGNVIRTNASISGAECGCQAEIGSACSMTSAAKAQISNMNLKQIEYAAEVAMEHHLGLTCDPVHGYVQIPCIERNAVAAMRAINSVTLASFLFETRKISFDAVVETMYHTGKDLLDKYRETSNGGLAALYK
ncbi:MAG: L-serine ammonia-lyase, iron-sulfur-dependent, subunit alpha [Solobacterium sp.]|nr:L-serine ammonia-lyase, iron-sulfur-dependent, subunit alpha [Solobacterium sp.]MDY2732302.1 L-serine ammonia-lyase, iron-sulfur-dependent, subunit alpha [Erysipelotrichaceae bacterium]MDD5982392.1 L-serine ammonia-lyase, iron-sulfur-dependent, subunit alpha [Solobacterium sp.]MDD6121861.1 L-serine ammonia-lyase, iron-sulfur-dependent, subunit alpha [Solobacterium sp.]MDD6497592.1 L-serine ammonia-lyase, iron-sulfur-dependent, subunit alpha [Solobacterium sp.]